MKIFVRLNSVMQCILLATLFIDQSACKRLNRLQHWQDSQNIEKIQPYLESHWDYLQLEGLRALESVPYSTWQDHNALEQILMEILNDRTESCYNRAQASTLLAKTQNPQAVLSIIDAMNICDDESRFQMMLALESFSQFDETAKGEMHALTQDDDFFIQKHAQNWMKQR